MSYPARTAAAALLALVPAGCGGQAPPPGRGGPGHPDLVLICLDTVRPDALGLTEEHPAAPFLASLAARSAVFEDTCSTSSWTAPATASLLTGLYPHRHGVLAGFFAQGHEQEAAQAAGAAAIEFTAIPADAPILAETLRRAGYATLAVTTNINIGPQIGFERGFERFVHQDGLPAARAVERALALAAGVEAGRPRFLYLHLNDAHDPYEERAPWFEAPPDARPLELDRARYASELAYLDHQLERLLAGLALDDDAVVAVVSDHGEEFMEHGGRFHRFTLHAEVNRVLFLLSAPGVRPGRLPGPVSLVDVAPTLLELVGVERPEGDGLSLAGLARGEGGDPLAGRVVFAHRLHPRKHERALWAATDGRHKLIERPGGVELYDLALDPAEREDVAASHPEVAARLAAALEAHRAGPAGSGEARRLELDPVLLERLRELGYADDGGDE